MHYEMNLRQILIMLLFVTLWGCQDTGLDSTDTNLEAFNDYLGKDKATALTQAVESLDEFLITNYPDKETQKTRTRAFLKQLSITLELDSTWIFDTEANQTILRKFETSGMRQEIKQYGYEEEFSNPYDSTLRFNIRGRFLNGLAKYAPKDTVIQQYVKDRQMIGNINMGIIVNSYLNRDIDYNNPFFRRMLVVDVYLDVIKWDMERK